MSNPYKRKALTLATSFVVAGTALASGASIAADKPAFKGKLNKSIVIKPNPGVVNPAGPDWVKPRVIIKIKRPQVVNPAPIRDIHKIQIRAKR